VIISNHHPYWHIRKIVLRDAEIRSLTLSYYKYVPQSLGDDRVHVHVPRQDFLDERIISNFLSGGPQDHELSIHSSVLLNSGEIFHIPMIDMSTSARAHLQKLRPFLSAALPGEISWFLSGRSFHGYGDQLICSSDWVKLMGALLLSNQKEMKPTVDPRWIGHRLLAGYSALRWTRRTSFYITEPILLGGGNTARMPERMF
jgi:hypothetical protein